MNNKCDVDYHKGHACIYPNGPATCQEGYCEACVVPLLYIQLLKIEQEVTDENQAHDSSV